MQTDIRRIKKLVVPAPCLLQYVAFQASIPRFVTVTRAHLPAGCQVSWLGVNTDTSCLEMHVWHPSFPIVPVGVVPPLIDDAPLFLECFALATVEEEKARTEKQYLEDPITPAQSAELVTPILWTEWQLDVQRWRENQTCDRPWSNGFCRRNKGHEGPCAVVPRMAGVLKN